MFFQANQFIDEQYDKAEEAIAHAQKINPQSAEAFSLLSSINYLKGNKDESDKYVKKVLETNPAYSDVFYTLAESCVSVRKYKEAVGFAEEAIEINPKDWKSMSLLGVNLMRTGQEQAGKDMLEKAFAGDPFNKWTYNTLTLLDSFGKFDHFEDSTSRSCWASRNRRRCSPLRRGVAGKSVQRSHDKVRLQARRPDRVRNVSGSPGLRRSHAWDAGSWRSRRDIRKDVRHGFTVRAPAQHFQLGQHALARVHPRHHA